MQYGQRELHNYTCEGSQGRKYAPSGFIEINLENVK